MKTVTRYVHHCLRCDKDFESASKHPKSCGKCKNFYWDRPRRNETLTQEIKQG